MVIKNPISLAGRGGGDYTKKQLPQFDLTLKVIGGCSPESGYSVQFNLLGSTAFYQLVFDANKDTLSYGAGVAQAQVTTIGNQAVVDPLGSPEMGQFDTHVPTADWTGGKVYLHVTYDGNGHFELDLVDVDGNVLYPQAANLGSGLPGMMRIEIVGQEHGAGFTFAQGAFRCAGSTMDVLNLMSGDAPIWGVVDGQPLMWNIGTLESSNLEMLSEFQAPDNTSFIIDYLLAP